MNSEETIVSPDGLTMQIYVFNITLRGCVITYLLSKHSKFSVLAQNFFFCEKNINWKYLPHFTEENSLKDIVAASILILKIRKYLLNQ